MRKGHRNYETNLSSLKKLVSDEDPTVNALRKTPAMESSAFKQKHVQEEATHRKEGRFERLRIETKETDK